MDDIAVVPMARSETGGANGLWLLLIVLGMRYADFVTQNSCHLQTRYLSAVAQASRIKALVGEKFIERGCDYETL